MAVQFNFRYVKAEDLEAHLARRRRAIKAAKTRKARKASKK